MPAMRCLGSGAYSKKDSEDGTAADADPAAPPGPDDVTDPPPISLAPRSSKAFQRRPPNQREKKEEPAMMVWVCFPLPVCVCVMKNDTDPFGSYDEKERASSGFDLCSVLDQGMHRD